MKDLVDGAMSEARDLMGTLMSDAVQMDQLSPDQQIERYMKLHRGNPLSMASFVVQRAPKGSNPLAEMRKYEAAMEKMLKAKGVR